MILSTEQLFRRYPATAVRAAAIAFPFRWDSMTGNGHYIWGEYKVPYGKAFYTVVDVIHETFHCTCPSREIPCKHILALWMLLLEKPETFSTQIDPPDWVVERLEKKQSSAAKERTAEEIIASDIRKENTRSERLEIMNAGAGDLDNWLSDLLRQGLSEVAAGDFDPAPIAARMVDSKLGGLAKRIRRLAAETSGPEDRESLLLSRIAELYIATKALQHLEALPEDLQQDVLTFCGVNYRKEDLLALPAISDDWTVMGQCEGEEEPNLRYRRVWLNGKKTGKAALLLDYAFGGADFPQYWPNGKVQRCELIFYPSAYPLRAWCKHPAEDRGFARDWAGYGQLSDFAVQYAAALGQNPLLQIFPAPLKSCVPVLQNHNLYCADQHQAAIPIARRGVKDWKLLGISAGHPVDIFGEWDGRTFYPLSVWMDGRFAMSL